MRFDIPRRDEMGLPFSELWEIISALVTLPNVMDKRRLTYTPRTPHVTWWLSQWKRRYSQTWGGDVK